MNLSGKLDLIQKFDLSNCFTQLDEQVLYRDEVRNVFRTACSMPTCDAIFGPHDSFRNWHGLRYGAGRIRNRLRQAGRSPTSLVGSPLLLPDDAVVISKSGARVVVVASRAQQRVVKLENHVHAERNQEIAKHTHEAFHHAGVGRHLPTLLDCGETNRIFYTISEICPNRPPFFRSLSGRAWPRFLQRKVMPVLQLFHDRNGVEIVDGPAWAERLRSKMLGRTIRPEMIAAWERNLAALSADPLVRMPMCMISGDLQPQNIHFHQGQIKILDWSNMEPAALVTDVFCDIFYRGMVDPGTPVARSFWQFLAGSVSLQRSHPTVRATAKVWLSWMDSWHEIKIGEAQIRIQLRGMCWDWMLTMAHPWLADGSLWRRIRFPDSFLES